MTVKESIMDYINEHPGATDGDIRLHLQKTHQTINQACRNLQSNGYLIRKNNFERENLIGNYPTDKVYIPDCATSQIEKLNLHSKFELQEDEIKSILNNYLVSDGWDVKVAWGHQKGIDIDATKENKRWIIEVKGPGTRQAMRVNYFIAILGEILQRMDDVDARYSIAFPDMEQFRMLWNKLPELSKERTKIDLILVDNEGNINFLY